MLINNNYVTFMCIPFSDSMLTFLLSSGSFVISSSAKSIKIIIVDLTYCLILTVNYKPMLLLFTPCLQTLHILMILNNRKVCVYAQALKKMKPKMQRARFHSLAVLCK